MSLITVEIMGNQKSWKMIDKSNFPQKTQNIWSIGRPLLHVDSMLFPTVQQRCIELADTGTTSTQHWFNVSCLLYE